MRKSLVLLISIILIAILMVTFVACTDSNKNKYTLELVNKDVDYFEFTVGEIVWSEISFYVYDSENVNLGEYVASESMVVDEDLDKLYSAGTKTIRLRYQGAELLITLKLNSPVYIREYNVVFNAGEGKFTNIEGHPSTLTIREDIIEAIPTPVRAGYEFLGWFEDSQGAGTKIITPYTLKRDLVLHAKWSDQRKYTVSYVVYENDRRDETLEPTNNIEHGTEIVLPKASERVGYVFSCYKVYDLNNFNSEIITIEFDENLEEYVYAVESNLEVRLCYVTKMLNLTFVSQAWTDVEEINGVAIVDNTYQIQVPYNTNLQKDVLPVPTLTELTGYTGRWIDNSTQKEPVFGRVTTDLFITAHYTINTYEMSFYDENEQIIPNATRTIDYNSTIDKVPAVPEKIGHNGVWKVINHSYDPNHSEGELIVFDLTKIYMVADVKVYASYTPKIFNINYHYIMDGMDEKTIETLSYKYGDVISSPIDLYSNRVVNGVEYKGYDAKYFEVLWYTSPTLAKEKKVTFPVDVVDSVDYYYELTKRPYKVEFRLPNYDYLEGIEFDPDPIYVNDSAKVIPPSLIMEGYEISAWYYNAYAPVFDITATYSGGDYVFYNGSYYSALKTVTGVLPSEDNTSWMIGARRIEYSLANYESGIPITDFHEYNEDPYYDRAFYAVVKVKEFNVSFNNLVISQKDNGYNYNYELIGSPVLVNYAEGITDIVPDMTDASFKPVYPDGLPGSFVFEGWYIENSFVTLPIDVNTYKVTSDVVLYAKWSDELVGTEGLIYTPDNVSNTTSYSVTGFETMLAEYSHITLRIPDHHNGKPVVAIADNAFAMFDKTLFVDEIIIPSNISQIGDNAFTSCYTIQKFNVENNTHFTVDEYGVLYSMDYSILYSAITLNSHAEISEYVIPQTVKRISGGAFVNVSMLEYISIEGISYSNQTINGQCALEEIGDYAFDGCTNLKSFIIPNSVISIGKYAFRSAYSLNEILVDTSNSNLLKVGVGAFADSLDALTRFEDENNSNDVYLLLGNVLISYVGDSVDLVLNKGIVAIADGAFDRSLTDNDAHNYQIMSLTVGADSSLKYMGHEVFLSCASLNAIYLLTDNKITCESNTFNGIALSATLYVDESLYDNYIDDDNYLVFGKDNILGV